MPFTYPLQPYELEWDVCTVRAYSLVLFQVGFTLLLPSAVDSGSTLSKQKLHALCPRVRCLSSSYSRKCAFFHLLFALKAVLFELVWEGAIDFLPSFFYSSGRKKTFTLYGLNSTDLKLSISELQALQAFEVLHSFLSHFQVECTWPL